MEPIEVECPNCGASLPAGDPQAGYRCTYCGTQFELRRARGAKTVAGVRLSPEQLEQLARSIGREVASSQVPRISPDDAKRIQRRHRRAVILGYLISITAFVGVSYLRWAYQSSRNPSGGSGSTLGTRSSVSQGFLWDDTAGPPQIARTNGRTLLVGRTRDVPGTDALSIDAFDAATGERAYRVGDLGTYADNSRFVHFAVVGDDLLVSTAKPSVRVHDAATGALRREVELTDRVDGFCRSEDGKHLYVVQADEKVFEHRAGNTELEPVRERPKKLCGRRRLGGGRGIYDPFATGKIRGAFVRRAELPKGPSIPGTKALARYEDGAGRIVVVGVKSSGTAVPRAAAFEGKDAKQPLWTTDVADVPLASLRDDDLLAAVAGARLYAAFGVGAKGWRLTALDTSSGTRLWSQDLRPLFSVNWTKFLVPVDDVLVVGRGSGLEVRRAADGELLYVLGTLNYDSSS